MNTNNRPLIAHLSMFLACAFWGLMAPLGKDAMTHGLDGLSMVTLRVVGGAVLFWTTSLFIRRERVPLRDVWMFAGAAIFGLVCNQCCYTIGLSITSPVNASIVTTSMPIFAMLLAALILILTSAAHSSDKVGDIRGDLLCLGAQFSFALYLSLFNKLIRRYNVFTINRWMFLWASLFILPFTGSHTWDLVTLHPPQKTWMEAGYVVFFGTYVGYILTMIGQKTLRPTVVSVYNYVQPLVAVTVSILTGIGVLKWSQALAVVLVFCGVALVTKSKSRRDMEKAEKETSPSTSEGGESLQDGSVR